MKWLKALGIAACLVLAGGFFYWHKNADSVVIRDFDFAKDAVRVDALFHKDDNWYWMISNAHQKTYSMDFMMRYRSSSQYENKHDLVIKVMQEGNEIIGFLAYFPLSPYVWQLLFLIVDSAHRKQGVGNQLLTYAVKDMVARGAVKVFLATRSQNVRAQRLYTKFGFKVLDMDEEFAHLSWYKQ